MPKQPARMKLLLCLFALAALSACAGGAGGGIGGGSGPAGLQDALPFPPLARGPSAVTTQTLLGREAEQRSSGAADQGDAILLDAVSSNFEYGLYRFNLGATPTSLDVTLSSGSFWLCLADFNAQHWEISGPFSSSQSRTLSNARYVNGSGDSWVGLVASRGETALLDQLEMSADTSANQPPVADISASADGPAPLNVTFDGSGSSDADGSIVLYEWDYTDNGSYDSAGAADTVQHIYNLPGTKTCRLRVTDNGGLTDEATVQVNVTDTPNEPPVAAISATPPQGSAPLLTQLDASGSTDSDGTIDLYEWDTDNNGSFDQATGTTPTLDHTFTDPGDYTVTVRVTDNDAATATASMVVTAQGWVIVTADPTVGAGSYTSLINLGGNPAIAYYSNENGGDLKFALSFTQLGTDPADWDFVTVDDGGMGGNVGIDACLCDVGGKPAIAYTDNSAPGMKYARSSTADGLDAADWTKVVINGPANNGGSFAYLQVVNGNPAIAYYDGFLSQDLVYRRSSTATGTSASDWASGVVVDSSGDVGAYPSLRVVSGNPAISYQSECSSTRHLKYARSTTVNGASALDWTQVVQVSSTDSTGWFTEMKIVNGHPAIAYWNGSGNDLYYAYSSTASGALLADWVNVPVDVDAGSSAGILPSLAVVATKPVIAHYEETTHTLLCSTSDTVDGALAADWNPHDTVDNDGDVGGYCSCIGLHGHIAISYQDTNHNQLKYAVRF